MMLRVWLACLLGALASSLSLGRPRVASLGASTRPLAPPLLRPLTRLVNLVTSLLPRPGLERTEAELKRGIAGFYDESSSIWLDVWGEHLHHGYYPSPAFRDHLQAQIDMIDRSLEFAYQGEPRDLPRTMVDVGCGVGGSSRYIARKYGCKGQGISLSPYQIDRARQFTETQNLSHLLEYSVNDAMKMPFEAGAFDLTWSMESGEHMPDKQRFINELVRVTSPGGRYGEPSKSNY